MKDLIEIDEGEIKRLSAQVAESYQKHSPNISERAMVEITRTLDVIHSMHGRKSMIEEYVYPNGEYPEPPIREGIDNATFTEV